MVEAASAPSLHPGLARGDVVIVADAETERVRRHSVITGFGTVNAAGRDFVEVVLCRQVASQEDMRHGEFAMQMPSGGPLLAVCPALYGPVWEEEQIVDRIASIDYDGELYDTFRSLRRDPNADPDPDLVKDLKTLTEDCSYKRALYRGM